MSRHAWTLAALVVLPLLVAADDPTQRQPDITLAKSKLGWEPKIALRDGLKKTIQYFASVDIDSFRAPTPNF